MNILIANDDGIDSPSLKALAQTLSLFGKVYCCAPETEQSGVSQAFTFRKPLVAREVQGWPGPTWALSGTPADCIKLAVNVLVKEPIDLVVSGVNLGLNLGVAIVYSGTVASAREAALWNIPAMALSVEVWDDTTAAAVKGWLEEFFNAGMQKKILANKYWNVNFPNRESLPLAQSRFCTMGTVMYTDSYTLREGAWVLSGNKDSELFEDPTDDYWHHHGYTTIVPLQIDQSYHGLETRPGLLKIAE